MAGLHSKMVIDGCGHASVGWALRETCKNGRKYMPVAFYLLRVELRWGYVRVEECSAETYSKNWRGHIDLKN